MGAQAQEQPPVVRHRIARKTAVGQYPVLSESVDGLSCFFAAKIITGSPLSTAYKLFIIPFNLLFNNDTIQRIRVQMASTRAATRTGLVEAALPPLPVWLAVRSIRGSFR